MAAMFAILEIGGKQYSVKENDVLRIEKIDSVEKETLKVDKVLLLNNEKETKIGTPYVAGAFVELEVLGNGKSDKVITFKMKAKKRYKRLKGHRQPYTDVKVVKVGQV